MPLKLEEPKTYTRLVFLKRDQGWGIGRTTLVKSWKLPDGYKAILKVNDIALTPPLSFFDCKLLREYLRELIPEDAQHNRQAQLENNIFEGQLQCLEFFKYFPDKLMFDYIFTGGLCITFEPYNDDTYSRWDSKLTLEETYILTTKNVEERLKLGETLADIDKNCRDTEVSEDVSFSIS